MSENQQFEPASGHMPIVTVVCVEALTDFRLRLAFSDRSSGIVEVRDLIRGPLYEPLLDSAYFARAELDEELGTVVWPNGADLSPEVLRAHLQPETLPNNEVAIAQSHGSVARTGQSVIRFYDRLRGSQLHYGDNLPVLRERVPDESIDLVYLDPPFNSKKTYNAFYRSVAGEVPEESRLAFEDFWIWDHRTAQQYEATLAKQDRVSRTLRALKEILGETDLMAYLVMMTPRLVELRRVLRPTGSLYLHCDQTASHYLKVLLDVIFGGENFLNNVVWLYGLGGNSKRYWPRKHDDLLWYSKSVDGQYFVADTVPARSQRMKGRRKKAPDHWDIPSINNMARERLGFPTQKPLRLLERIVRSSSPPEGVVLDPFCGCGTTIEAAERLGREWVGIDISYLAIEIVRRRLLKSFGSSIEGRYRLFGQPQSMRDAMQLYEQRTLDFEYWAVSLVNADPVLDEDSAFDGIVRFPMPEGQDDGLAAVKVGVNGESEFSVAATQRLVEAGAATMGVVIPLHPDAQLRRQAAKAGLWTWPVTGAAYPRVQVVSVEELLTGHRPALPPALQSYSIVPATAIG